MWKCEHFGFDDGMFQVQRYSRAYVSNVIFGLDLSYLLLLLQLKDLLIASWLFCFCFCVFLFLSGLLLLTVLAFDLHVNQSA